MPGGTDHRDDTSRRHPAVLGWSRPGSALAANGTPIGVASAYRNDLAPNDTWAFEAVAFDPPPRPTGSLEIVAD